MQEQTIGTQVAPLLIRPQRGESCLADVVQGHSTRIHDRLLEVGALLFRGFKVQSLEDFDLFISAFTDLRMDYTYASTPRTPLGNRVFTATEYPRDQEIPLHNESSYQREWPLKLALCCLRVATTGGETPIARMRDVGTFIGRRLLDKFEELGVTYLRHYRPFVDLPWQKVFHTDDPKQVSEFCKSNDIECEWLDSDTLRTRQTCQGTARHPITGSRIFFNQAHLFHISSLGPPAEKAIINYFGKDRLPRQTYYGNGQEIPTADLELVRDAFTRATVTFSWRPGDILLLDNMQYAHGRRPFVGERQVLAALMEPYSEKGISRVRNDKAS